jgi:aldehyde:ferredoxin oxidoreductase
MVWNGYAGAGLWVDLATGETRKEPLDPDLVERFVGGFGFTNKLAYDLIPRGVDPLSPENVVVIGSGALSGTLSPGSAKVMATTKLPINNAIGTPFGGGFSDVLKCAGYDYVVITGRAGRPTYLHIQDGDVRLVDADFVISYGGKTSIRPRTCFERNTVAKAASLPSGRLGRTE